MHISLNALRHEFALQHILLVQQIPAAHNCHCRSTPWAAQREEDASTSTVVQVLMVSESNVCRSVLAEVIMRKQLSECGLDSMVHVESKVDVLPLRTHLCFSAMVSFNMYKVVHAPM